MTGLRSFSFSNVAPSPSSSPASDAPPSNLRSHLAPQAGPELISTTYINSVPQPPVRVPLTTSALSHMSLSPGQRRWDPSATPSATSISDGEESAEIDEYTARRINEGSPWLVSDSKGKGKERVPLGYRRNTIRSARDAGLDGTGLVNQLPPEILRHIFKSLPTNRDVKAALLVSRSWCVCAFSLLWNKPSFTQTGTLVNMLRVLASPTQTFPYASTIRRLNLSHVAKDLSDPLVACLSSCVNVERLTMTGATSVSSSALYRVVQGMNDLVAIDLSDIPLVEDEVIAAVARRCARLQGLNLSGCKKLTDRGILEIAKHCPMLKRMKLAKCTGITEKSLVPLVERCPLLLEVDLGLIPQTTDTASRSVWINALHLRELRFSGCPALTDNCIPNLADLRDDIDTRGDSHIDRAYGLVKVVRPVADTLDHLRTVDLTGCNLLGDNAVDALICNAPKLRSLTLAKCTGLTDASLLSIGRLGKHLHHWHMGHVSSLTDAAVKKLVRTCTRIRYIDLAGCTRLTDDSVVEMANCLPKLKRIGLVKVVGVTDVSVYALSERRQGLERIHLSYCESISVKSITCLVSRLRDLTHLSLTAVPAFLNPELQQFCRQPPAEFNEHQAASFCVFSGHGVRALREHLLNVEALNATGSEDGSRRDSDSSASSVNGPLENHMPIPARNSWHNGTTDAVPIRSSAFTNATSHQQNYNFFAPVASRPPSSRLEEDTQHGVQAWRQMTAPSTRRAVIYDSPFSTAVQPDGRNRVSQRRTPDNQDSANQEGDTRRSGLNNTQDTEEFRLYRPPRWYYNDS